MKTVKKRNKVEIYKGYELIMLMNGECTIKKNGRYKNTVDSYSSALYVIDEGWLID